MMAMNTGLGGSSKTAVLGAALGNAVRMLRGGEHSSRLAKSLISGARSMVGTFTRVLRSLMLQMVGLIFLCFGVVVGSKCIHEYQQHLAGRGNRQHLVLSGLLAIMFIYFGISSFWRARK